MSHTSGPWETHQDIDGRNSVRVCKPDGTHDRGCRSVAEAEIIGVPRLEAEANARLIAAAPELWVACKSAVPYLRAEIDMMLPPGSTEARRVYDLLQAAILKAEGK